VARSVLAVTTFGTAWTAGRKAPLDTIVEQAIALS
jgi:hypothetical protein